MTCEERAGLEEIKKGIENYGWMVYSTDKSGKIVLDTQENFLNCMSEHFIGHRIVNFVNVNLELVPSKYCMSK